MEKILLAYGLSPKKLLPLQKVMVHSPDGNTNFFDIVAGVLQGDTRVLFIICLDYILQILLDLMKENIFTQKKKKKKKNLKKKKKLRSRKYPTETITDTDYIDYLAFLANTPAQAEYLLHSLEQAARKHWPLHQL